MKVRMLIFLSLVMLLVVASTQLSLGEDGWGEQVGPGIEYRAFEVQDPGPVRVFVARMDRQEASVTLESTIAQGKLASGLETVSRMAQRYDQAINFWGLDWGSRNQVVVAINGSYIEPSGAPQSGQIQSGWYSKRYNDNGGGSGFVWKLDRSYFVGQCVSHPSYKQVITNQTRGGDDLPFDSINVARGTGKTIIYTPQYDKTTRTDGSGVEVLVEMSKPMMVAEQGFTIGVVRRVLIGQGSTPIPFDHVVFSGQGAAGDNLAAAFQEGDQIRIYQEITHYDNDCHTDNLDQWAGAYTSISGAFNFLKNGVIQTFDHDAGARERHPRTAIAYNDSYVYFIVADGRQPNYSIGMTIEELAIFSRDTLGATGGISQDGGGSSTMLINGTVVNTPSEKCHQVFLPFVMKGNQGDNQLAERLKTLNGMNVPPAQAPALIKCERAVGNGIMMVVVQPKETSDYFTAEEQVITLAHANLRLGPGTNYEPLTVIAQSTSGVVVDHSLKGVKAKGTFWWKVSFGDNTGWMAQELLGRVISVPTSFREHR